MRHRNGATGNVFNELKMARLFRHRLIAFLKKNLKSLAISSGKHCSGMPPPTFTGTQDMSFRSSSLFHRPPLVYLSISRQQTKQNPDMWLVFSFLLFLPFSPTLNWHVRYGFPLKMERKLVHCKTDLFGIFFKIL